jgi:hypothetical protein
MERKNLENGILDHEISEEMKERMKSLYTDLRYNVRIKGKGKLKKIRVLNSVVLILVIIVGVLFFDSYRLDNPYILTGKSFTNNLNRSPQFQRTIIIQSGSGHRIEFPVDDYDYRDFNPGDTVIVGRSIHGVYIKNKKHNFNKSSSNP